MSEASPLAGKLALVTGASRGLGAAVAKQLAAEGAHAILVARTVGALEEVDDAIREAGGHAATLVPLDLRDTSAIDRLGASLYERYGRLDILAACAGMLGALSPVCHVKPDLWEEIFAVNTAANYRLVRSLDPLLRQAETGRAVFVTCEAAIRPEAYWGAYGASKAALEAMVRSYAAELGKTHVKANLFDPGPLRTALRARAFPGEDAADQGDPSVAALALVKLTHEDCSHQGARIVHKTTS